MSEEKQTPLMQQYFRIKAEYPDCIVLFQVGDFYELFFDDAIRAAACLAIALTKRGKSEGKDIPLCGVPVHALEFYLLKLIKAGFKIALADQVSKPIPGTIVERKVTRVFTPGTLTETTMLDDKSASYILTCYGDTNHWGLVFGEVLTAQLFATTVSRSDIRVVEAELVRFFPDEIVLPVSLEKTDMYRMMRSYGYPVSLVEPAIREEDSYKEWMNHQFEPSLRNRIEQQTAVAGSVSLLYDYLKKTNESALSQMRNVNFYQADDYLMIDPATQKNLEIVVNSHDGTRKNTLLSVLDEAVTPMGSRTIKKWLQRPLTNLKGILQRQEVVAALAENVQLCTLLEQTLSQFSDIERIIGRLGLGRALANDIIALKETLKRIPRLTHLALQINTFVLVQSLLDKMSDFQGLVHYLESALNDDTSLQYRIKKGFSKEFDTLFDLVAHAEQKILLLEQQESTKTGIGSLKIIYNQVFGYSIEITKTHQALVPEHYKQQQTLANRNRYVIQELVDLEREIISARGRIDSVEKSLFESVVGVVIKELNRLRPLAAAVAYLDGLVGFAKVAYSQRYVAPTYTENSTITIEQGRHPVVEKVIADGFVANNTILNDDESLIVLTGPNMGGKSTYLRQVALIALMAQCGSLVPATNAELFLVDRIFSRIGSGDNLAAGKSTFLVEMEETAIICAQATNKSLVILDEVGRGTSTYDGIALAQAICEYLLTKIGARTLFATHYHELTELEQKYAGIKNYHMKSHRTNAGITFFHTVLPGPAYASFGIDVARLAGLPAPVVDRAEFLLAHLKQDGQIQTKEHFLPAFEANCTENVQKDPKMMEIAEIIRLFDLDAMTPKQAYFCIADLQERLKKL